MRPLSSEPRTHTPLEQGPSISGTSSALRFKHSGRLGDLLFALPTIKALGGGSLLVGVDVPGGFDPDHPSGALQITERTLAFALPFLTSQEYIREVESFMHGCCSPDLRVDHDFDAFRNLGDKGFDLRYGYIAKWFAWIAGANPDLTAPWIDVSRVLPTRVERKGMLEVVRHSVVVNLTRRYRNEKLRYGFLTRYPCVFVGLPEEFLAFRASVPNAYFYKAEDLLEVAEVIRECRLFVGNQSSFFALAEGMKINRVLEQSTRFPSVIPHGPNGLAVLQQYILERSIRERFERSSN